MGRNIDDIIKALPAARQKRIRDDAATLREEYASLRELRRALGINQENVAKALGINQENVSRMEDRHDILLSTLVRAIEALGGKLELKVAIKNGPTVNLGKMAAAAAATPARRRARAPRPAAKAAVRKSRSRAKEFA